MFDHYLIEADYGRLGTEATINFQKAAKRDVIRDLVAGEHDMPLRVIAFNVSEGWSRDVSEDIAREIAKKTEYTPAPSLRFFLERHLPVDEMNELAAGFRDAAE